MAINPNSPKNTKQWAPILRADIEEAQRNTNSNAAAARYLNVGFERYKRYAQLYGIYERHSNQKGTGIEKGFSKRPSSVPLKDILAGKHPKYSLSKLKNRLIARKKVKEACALCGFQERRITDRQIPLMLHFKDGDRQNYSMDNMELLCYNCMFLTSGAPTAVYRNSIKKSFTDPDHIKPHAAPSSTDQYDVEDADSIIHEDITLTPEEIKQLLNEE